MLIISSRRDGNVYRTFTYWVIVEYQGTDQHGNAVWMRMPHPGVYRTEERAKSAVDLYVRKDRETERKSTRSTRDVRSAAHMSKDITIRLTRAQYRMLCSALRWIDAAGDYSEFADVQTGAERSLYHRMVEVVEAAAEKAMGRDSQSARSKSRS